MIEAAVNLILIIAGAVFLVVWIISRVNWDGEYHCDKSECDTCPFPCKERNDHDYSGKN